MTLSVAIGHLAFIILIAINSCNIKNQNNEKSDEILSKDNSYGIVYFSFDNGLTWGNKSTGLPSTTNIVLGGIAGSENKLALFTKDSGLYFFNFPEQRWFNIPTDKQIIENNPGALLFFKDNIYIGTQLGGIFRTTNEGKSWTKLNTGFNNLTIRKLAEIENKLYAATNSGLFTYNDLGSQWELDYGHNSLQVNGITTFDKKIYIATNQGAFTSPIGKKDWKKIFSKGALHNISADDKSLYAMVYNELFSSHDKGDTWLSIQNGLPAQLYTFNVVNAADILLAGQWNGVYRKNREDNKWVFSSNGLPADLAIVNMLVHNKIIVISGNKRILKTGMTIDK